MKLVILQKDVTVMEDFKGGSSVVSMKHKHLEKYIASETMISVSYPYGQMKRRRNQLAKLGFHLSETIWPSTKELHSEVREIWSR